MTATNHTPDITNHTEKITAHVVAATDETEKVVKQVICDKLGLEEAQLQPGLSFGDDLGIDSLDVFELIIEIENVFRINIPEDDAEKTKKSRRSHSIHKKTKNLRMTTKQAHAL